MSEEVDFTKSEFPEREIKLPLTKEIKDELFLQLLELPDDKKGLFRDSITFINSKVSEEQDIEDSKFIKEWNSRDLDYENGVKENISKEDFLIEKLNKVTGEIIGYKVNIDKVAKYIENKFNIRTIFGIREETIDIYIEGIWVEKGRGIIKAEIEKLLEAYANNHAVSEILEKIKRRTEISVEDANKIPLFKRCLKNGVLDLSNIESIKIIEHSKIFNFRSKWDIDYNPLEKCPKILKFFEETFYPEDIPKFQEWLGLHLVRKYLFKKFAIFHGPKNTGKTVLLNLITIFLNNNICGLSLQEISRGKPFDLLALRGKDGNIFDDLSSQDMKATGGIKKSVGDGFIDAEQKFGDKIRFRNSAKQTFACNKIPNPGSDLDDEAYYSRILLFPIDNIHSREEQDINLIEKLTTKKELSGLLNFALGGYKKLIIQNGFSNDKSPEETKFLMVQNGNSLAEFASQILIQEDGNKISKETMYKVYCNWCRNHKPQLSPDSKDKIGKNLTKFASYTQSLSNGKERYWSNVKFTPLYYKIIREDLM